MSLRGSQRNPALVDLHVHSTCSWDGRSGLGEYARRARSLELVEVGFCEHVDLDPRDQSYAYLDPARYDREMAAAQALVPNIRLRKAIELNYQASLAREVQAWQASHDWDYVMLSVHLVDYAEGWAMVSESGRSEAYFATHSQRQAYAPYFEELLRAAQSGLGDLLSHLDLVKRFGVAQYGRFDPTMFEEEIRAVLRAAIGGGMGLEINTSGLRQLPAELYPDLTVLYWYRELGGEVLAVGSDAHHVDDLGAGIVEALTLARQAGFRAIATFERRQVRWLDL